MSWRNIVTVSGVVVIVSLAVLAVFVMTGKIKRSGMEQVQERVQRVTEREQKILAWIVERNPQATIKDFADFPAVLLVESAGAGIDFRIVMAMIDKESQFNPRAVGSSGEIGLMQILPATAASVVASFHTTGDFVFRMPVRGKPGGLVYADLGTLGDPKENIRIGIAYLKKQVERFGVNPVAIRAYNRNPENARQHRPWDRYAEDIGLRLVSIVHEFPR